jgi:DNA-binding SARP family transcriptional activator
MNAAGVGDAEFRVLGPLELWVQGTQRRLRGTKQQIVLATLLLANGKQVPLSRLAEAVWGEDAPATATKQIRNAISDLRRLLAGAAFAITPVADGYKLDIAGSVLDATAFARRVDRARQLRDNGSSADSAAEFRAALSLWSGPALAGLYSAALEPQLVSLDEQRLAVLEECVELELALGRHESLISDLSIWVAEHPLRERLVAQLMLTLYRSGAGAHALAVFERTRRTLQRELGVRPGPELEQLHRRIMANDLALRLPPRPHTAGAPWCSNLPGSVAHFTGRRTELRQLRDILRAHDAGNPAAPVIIAIDGLPGVGKTALAVRLCHEVTPAYPGAQLFIDLHGYALRHPVLDPFPALATLLGAMGVPAERVPPTLEARSAMWRGQLADRRALVILDNVASTAQIGPLLPATPGCLAVVTSRHRLTGLHYTFQLSVHELSRAEGRSLFGRVVGDQRPLAEPDAVDTVAQQCGRLPLAIRVAATKLRHRPAWAVAYLASRLADDRRRLAELGTEDGGAADTFALSYERLAPIHQWLFRLIGMMRGPVISSQDVAGLADLPTAHIEHLLEGLVDTHLLQEVTPGRYQLNELVRAYSAQLATPRTAAADDGARAAAASQPSRPASRPR